MTHVSEWTGLPCIRKDCDGTAGCVSVASQYGAENHIDAEEEVG